MTTVPASQKISPFAVFRNPSFTRVWFAQLISTIGDSFTMIAIGIYIFRLTGSALQVGLMLMATSVPTMILGLFAGVFVDRFDRKKIMMAADISRALLIFLIPTLLQYHVAWLYIIVMLISSIGTFFHPAFDSVLPELATDEELTAANSMIAISSFGSTAVGFAASGMIAAYSIEWAFYIDAVTFLVSALFLASLKIDKLEVAEVTNVSAVFRNMRDGAKLMIETPVLKSLLGISLLYALSIGIWNTMLLPFATDALGATEFEYGLQEGATSIGFVVASLLMARYASRLREGVWISLGLLGMGFFGVFYSFSTSVPLAILLVTLTGFWNAPYAVARRTLMQRNVDREMRGRVFGTMMTVGHVVMLLGMGLAGLADYVGVREMMLAGTLLALVAGAAALFVPGVGRPAAEWLRAVSLLRTADQAPGLSAGRPATLADFDRLLSRMPSLTSLSQENRERMIAKSRFVEAAEGDVVVRHGEISDQAYFVLNGRVFAGRTENGQENILEVLNGGDFFGEIAALTGIPRTANIVVEQPSELIQVPAEVLREMSSLPEWNRVFMSKMTERMIRMNMIEMPKMLTLDQSVMRDLRTESPAPQSA